MYIQFNDSSKLLPSKLPTLSSTVLGSNQIPASSEIRMEQQILNNCAEVRPRHIRHSGLIIIDIAVKQQQIPTYSRLQPKHEESVPNSGNTSINEPALRLDPKNPHQSSLL